MCLPGNEGESFLEAVHQRPQGRCCLSIEEEDSPARGGCQRPFFSRPIAIGGGEREEGGGEGNFRSLGGGICLIPDYPVGWIEGGR